MASATRDKVEGHKVKERLGLLKARGSWAAISLYQQEYEGTLEIRRWCNHRRMIRGGREHAVERYPSDHQQKDTPACKTKNERLATRALPAQPQPKECCSRESYTELFRLALVISFRRAAPSKGLRSSKAHSRSSETLIQAP